MDKVKFIFKCFHSPESFLSEMKDKEQKEKRINAPKQISNLMTHVFAPKPETLERDLQQMLSKKLTTVEQQQKCKQKMFTKRMNSMNPTIRFFNMPPDCFKIFKKILKIDPEMPFNIIKGHFVFGI